MLAVALAGVLVGALLVMPVLVNAAARGTEAEVGRLETELHESAAKTSELAAQISALSAPDRVAEQAAELGLGPARTVRYLEVSAPQVGVEGDISVAGR